MSEVGCKKEEVIRDRLIGHGTVGLRLSFNRGMAACWFL